MLVNRLIARFPGVNFAFLPLSDLLSTPDLLLPDLLLPDLSSLPDVCRSRLTPKFRRRHAVSGTYKKAVFALNNIPKNTFGLNRTVIDKRRVNGFSTFGFSAVDFVENVLRA